MSGTKANGRWARAIASCEQPAFPCRRLRFRRQAQYPAHAGRARLPRHGGAGADAGRRRCWRCKPDGVFLSNGPGDPEPCDYAIAAIREILASAACRPSASASATSCWGSASGAKTMKMKFGHHGANHPVQGPRHRAGDDHQPEPRLCGGSGDAAGQSARSPTCRCSTAACRASRAPTGRRSASRATRRRAPARTTSAICSTALSMMAEHDRQRRWTSSLRARLCHEASADAQTHRHQQHPDHRRRPDRHRPGLRVRLFRRAGLQGAARGGLPRHPGQLQSGDHHDRPGDGRRHLYRADHLADGREHHRQGAAGRAAADHGRPDRAQLRARSGQARRAGKIRRRDDRRVARGHRQGRRPREVQGRR